MLLGVKVVRLGVLEVLCKDFLPTGRVGLGELSLLGEADRALVSGLPGVMQTG